MKKLPDALIAQIKKAMADNPQVSQVTMARRFGVSQVTISRIKQEVDG